MSDNDHLIWICEACGKATRDIKHVCPDCVKRRAQAVFICEECGRPFDDIHVITWHLREEHGITDAAPLGKIAEPTIDLESWFEGLSLHSTAPLSKVVEYSERFKTLNVDLLKCPICRSDAQHIDAPFVIDADAEPAGWGGSGDLILIPLWCEVGHRWQICLAFHEGRSYSFVRF